MKKENKNQVCTSVTEGACSHEAQKKTSFVRQGRSGIKKIMAVCIVAAILGTVTVTAAATNLFGLTTVRTGTYGLNVKVENAQSDQNVFQAMNIRFGYLPDQYASGNLGSSWLNYSHDDEYFNAMIFYGDDNEFDLTNVIDSSETEYDGHKTVLITFKEAENTDRLFYGSFKYFDEYHCLVRCSGTDYQELLKITEQLCVEPAPENQRPEDTLDDSEYVFDGAIKDYSIGGTGYRDAFLAGRLQEAKLGETIRLSTADDDEEPVSVNARVTSVQKRENADGLDRNDFVSLGRNNTFGMFFNYDGSLIKEKVEKSYEGADEEHLGVAKDVKSLTSFYLVDMEMTAEEDIDDLHRVFELDSYIIDVGNRFSTKMWI